VTVRESLSPEVDLYRERRVHTKESFLLKDVSGLGPYLGKDDLDQSPKVGNLSLPHAVGELVGLDHVVVVEGLIPEGGLHFVVPFVAVLLDTDVEALRVFMVGIGVGVRVDTVGDLGVLTGARGQEVGRSQGDDLYDGRSRDPIPALLNGRVGNHARGRSFASRDHHRLSQRGRLSENHDHVLENRGRVLENRGLEKENLYLLREIRDLLAREIRDLLAREIRDLL